MNTQDLIAAECDAIKALLLEEYWVLTGFVPPAEAEALKAMYEATGNNSWTDNHKWR